MSSNNRRIQRVPALLIAEEEDEKKKNDYYPKVASIGPYHYGKPELAQVEKFKPFAVDLLVRSLEEKDFFYQKVLAMINQVRNCYEEESVAEYSDADLAQMMLRDASLIIAEMEIYLEHGKTYDKRKAMIDHFGRLTGAVLFRDFILVENQIPLCVIQLLIELRYGVDEEKMINNYVNKCIFGEIRPIVKSSRVPLHLLEFMHIILVYDCVKTKESSRGSYSTGDIDMEVMAPNHTLLLRSPQHATKTSNRSDEESSSGELGDEESSRGSYDMEVMAPNHTLLKSGGDPNYPTMAPNHTLMLGSHKHATETSNRANQESSRGLYSTGDIQLMAANQAILCSAPKHTLTLEPCKPAIETIKRSIEESSSGELGAPGASNHTLKVGPREPPTKTSNWSIEEGCSGKSGGAPEAPMAPNHTLMLGSHKHAIVTAAANHTLIMRSPRHATETSNKAKKVTHWFRKVMELKARIHFRPSATQSLLSNKAETSNQAKKVTHSFRKVMELKARGIHFRPSATQSLLDVGFKSGFFYATLQLPEMFVSHYSKPFFKNLVAYELLPGVETEPTVTSYINLMQSLVERPEDLEELREKKIVYNQLGSDEEALNVFKDINTHGASDDELYLEVREEIQKHYNNRIKTWIAELIHTHFRSPWTFAAFLAAAAIIALTAAQLYYAVHPVADKTPTSS